jgi:hypothetical protein
MDTISSLEAQVSLNRPGNKAPNLGNFRDNWVRDQLREIYDWSRESHEQNFCRDNFWMYKLYRGWTEPRLAGDYHSNICVNLAFPMVELVASRLMEPWSAGDEITRAIPEEEEARSRAPKVSAYVNNIFVNRTKRSYAKHMLMTKAGILYSRGIMRPYIRHDPPASILQRIPILMQAGMRMGSYVDWSKIPPQKRVDMDYVDPFDCWIVPGVRHPHESDWVFERGYVTTSMAHARQESGEWDSSVMIEPQDALGHDEYHMKRLTIGAPMGQVQARSTDRHPMHRVVSFQGRLEVKDTKGSRAKYENLDVHMLDERYLAKTERLKTWDGKPNYIFWEPTPDLGTPGDQIGLIEPIEDLLLEINDLENIGLDNARKILESPLLIDPQSTKQTTLNLGPGAINWIKNPRASVAPLEMKDLPRSFYEQTQFLQDLVQRISGVNEALGFRGLNPSQNPNTATAATMISNLAASRFGPFVQSLDRDYYRPMAQWIHETSKLWMRGSETVRMPANPLSPFSSIGPDDFDASMTYHFNTKALDATSEQRQAQWNELTRMVLESMPLIQAQGYIVDVYELFHIAFDEGDRGAELEAVIKKLTPEMLASMPMPLAAGGPMQALSPGIPGMPGAGQPPMQPPMAA